MTKLCKHGKDIAWRSARVRLEQRISLSAHTVFRKIYQQLHQNVPEDVQVIGFDGVRLFGDLDYICSTIVQPIPEIAEMCVELLLQEIFGDISDCESYFFLLDEPDNFQREFQLLAAPDGSCPDTRDYATTDKVIAWPDRQC